MKLILEKPIKNISELELTPIQLFNSHGKSAWLDLPNGNLIIEHRKGKEWFTLKEKEQFQKRYDELYVVTKEISDNKNKLKEFILNADIEATYYFQDYHYQYFHIDTDSRINIKFSWALSIGYTCRYPMASGNMVKYYQTEKNAKLSLIKYLNL